LNLSKAGQRAKKRGVNLPVCAAPAAAPLSQSTPPVVVNVEPAAACTKAVRQCARK
jgi:hypothetical protein